MSSEPVRILAVYPTTGVWSTQGINCIRGAQLAADDVNAEGGVLGREVDLEVVAVGSEPESAATRVAQRLFQGPVSAIVGAYLSNHTLAYSSLAEAHQVPAITESFVSEVIERGYRFIFKTTPLAADFSRAAFRYLADIHSAAGRPIPQVAIAAADDASGSQQYASALEAASKIGFEISVSKQYPAGLGDPEELVSELVGCRAGALLLNGPVTVLTRLVERLRTLGSTSLIVGLGGAGVLTQSFADSLGSGVDGIFSTVAWNADISPASARVNERFVSRFGSRFMPVEAGTAYVAVRLAVHAVQLASSAGSGAVAQALRDLDISGGLASMFPGGRIAFDARGINRHSHPLLIQYQKGIPVTVHPPEDAARKPVM